MSLHTLPDGLLNEIFQYISFADVSRVRGVSQNLHRASRKRLNSAFLELGPRLMTRYTAHLILMKSDKASYASGDTIFRGRFLKLLGSEHSILLALCRNYITNGEGCFSPGEILDLFIELQQNKSTSRTQDDESKKLARLVLLIDRYLDWFENFRLASDVRCAWFGTCIVDLLDSYLRSTYHLVASHHGATVKFSGRYEISGQAEIPPRISEPLGGPITWKELSQVLKYIRKHVRWSNFVSSFQDDSEEGDEFLDEIERVSTRRTQEGYERDYKKKQFGIGDSVSSVESLCLVINLSCDRRRGPARLRGGFEDLHEWRKEMESINHDMVRSRPPSTESLIMEPLDELNKTLKSKTSALVTIKENTEVHTRKHTRNKDDDYTFTMEIRSVYPTLGNSHNSGAKFGEAMLHVSHSPETMFAAQTECSLY